MLYINSNYKVGIIKKFQVAGIPQKKKTAIIKRDHIIKKYNKIMNF